MTDFPEANEKICTCGKRYWNGKDRCYDCDSKYTEHPIREVSNCCDWVTTITLHGGCHYHICLKCNQICELKRINNLG